MPKPINEFHGLLLEKRKDLLARLQNRQDIQITGRMSDPLDEASAQSARNTAVDDINRNADLLKRVNKAIDKFEHGDGGECEGCGEVIPPARLKVVPWAEYCIHCQHEEERKGL